MGQDKASLMFHGKSMLALILEAVASTVSHIVLVKAHGQLLPKLPAVDACLEIVEDQTPDCGPVEGMRTGFSSLPEHYQHVFVSGCDTPLLSCKSVEQLFSLAEKSDRTGTLVVPYDGKRLQPLAAVYPRSFSKTLENQIKLCNLKLMSVIQQAEIVQVESDELKMADPQLGLLLNINTPQQYQAALQQAKP
ncbi:MAG: hypothetical protein COA78_02055 [Blastopirellula sp.]|nr:MAG: hypothetical protein COA78_02055 [Blastopirellula sp.]